jgi:aminoglycoside 2'-N-acetyltransferase I
MVDVELAHTADADPAVLDAAHALLRDAFGDELDAHDWEHALGGMHAFAYDDGELVGHASLIQRRLLHRGRALRCGYVEAVVVRRDQRRRGVGSALMRALERIIRGAYDLGALGASDDGLRLYAALGWQVWRGRLSALTPDGIRATPEEQGGVFVLDAAGALDLDGELTCDWRDGAVW